MKIVKSKTMIKMLGLMCLFTLAACSGNSSKIVDVQPDPDVTEDSTDTTPDTFADIDSDNVRDDVDNCPEYINTKQEDFDKDGQGDACDSDDDNDGVLDSIDEYPLDPTKTANSDTDSLENSEDNCPYVANEDQADFDGDGQGDVCDSDDDNDGVADITDAYPYDAAKTANTDGDNFDDSNDNCPLQANDDQKNFDGDTMGDVCDSDDDNDGVADADDLYPKDPTEWADKDGDSIADHVDNCVNDSNAGQVDFDKDGLGDVCDPDADGDTVVDTADNCRGVVNKDQANLDGDSLGDACDDDADGDRVTVASGDCNDYDDDVYPTNSEHYDFKDNNCDSIIDQDLVVIDAPVKIRGKAAGDQFGAAVAHGDINGDGYDDLVVGAPYDDTSATDAGAVALILSRGTSLPADSYSSDYVVLTGEVAGDRAGASVAVVDVNGDLIDDVVVGAPYFDGAAGIDTGKVYVIYGKSTFTNGSLSTANVVAEGEHASDYLGYSAAKAGNVNGDNVDDVLVGAPGNDAVASSSGKVYLIYGSRSLVTPYVLSAMTNVDGVQFFGEASGDALGSYLNQGADVDSDGFSDVLLASTSANGTAIDSGKIYLVYGSSSLTTYARGINYNALFNGEAASDAAGNSVAVGDINNDGHKDIIIADAVYQDMSRNVSGRVYVELGSNRRWNTNVSLLNSDVIIDAEKTGDQIGTSVAVGDFNSDGRDDLVVSAAKFNNRTLDTGKIYMFLGDSNNASGMDLTDADVTILGKVKNDITGQIVTSAGDINDDGRDDLVIANQYNDRTGADRGIVYIY